MTKEQIHAERDVTNPMSQFYGTVVERTHQKHPDAPCYYLVDDDGIRYDLPRMVGDKPMKKFKDEYVSIIGRLYKKTVGTKDYNKIVLIAIKSI